jgi:hypothetical protein
MLSSNTYAAFRATTEYFMSSFIQRPLNTRHYLRVIILWRENNVILIKFHHYIGDIYPEGIRFVPGKSGFLLSCLPSLFDFGMIRTKKYSSLYQTTCKKKK